jgi:CheY-like chemotaxis protein
MDVSKITLLIVEDVPDTLELLNVTLTFKGYRVVTATNGQDALELISKVQPALVITDILMPKMDGFSLVHRLRIEPETRNLPVIFLSATYVAPADKEFAAAIGASRFLEKPIDIEALLKTINELLAQSVFAPPTVIDDRDFYEGYRKRLKAKLEEKISQIARTEGMLDALPEEEQKTFRKSLQLAISERDEIQFLLDKIYKYIDKDNSE